MFELDYGSIAAVCFEIKGCCQEQVSVPGISRRLVLFPSRFGPTQQVAAKIVSCAFGRGG